MSSPHLTYSTASDEMQNIWQTKRAKWWLYISVSSVFKRRIFSYELCEVKTLQSFISVIKPFEWNFFNPDLKTSKHFFKQEAELC